MDSLYRSFSIYSRYHILLRMCSPSTKIMASHTSHPRAFSSGDGRTTTPIESFSSEGNDYEEQFPPLGISKNKSGKGSGPSMVDLGSTNLSTTSKSSQRIQEEAKGPTVEVGTGTCSKHKGNGSRKSTNLSTPNNSSQFQSWTSGKDAMSLNRNFEPKNKDKGPRRRLVLPHDIYAPVEKRNHITNFSTPSQRSKSRNWTIRKDDLSLKRNQGYLGRKNRDQSPKRRQELPFDICFRRNDRRITDDFVEEEANGEETEQIVELSNKHRVLRPGMVLLKHFLTHDAQVDIVKTCRELGVEPKGFYRPGYGDGSKLRLQMMCLGRNWDPQTKYGINIEKDSEPPKIPEMFGLLVEQAIREAQALIDSVSGKEDAESELPMMSPDICIVNFYTETGRLGLHQDRDESRESMKKGLPIVSFSIGDSAEFLYAEERDVEKAERVKLESGDVLIFGGESRMIFHGVKSIIPNSAPICLLHDSKLRTGRLNLTFRHF